MYRGDYLDQLQPVCFDGSVLLLAQDLSVIQHQQPILCFQRASPGNAKLRNEYLTALGANRGLHMSTDVRSCDQEFLRQDELALDLIQIMTKLNYAQSKVKRFVQYNILAQVNYTRERRYTSAAGLLRMSCLGRRS